MHGLILFFSILVFPAPKSEVVKYKPLTMAMNVTDRLLIKGYRGRVFLRPGTGNLMVVKLSQKGSGSMEDWLFTLDREGEVVRLQVSSPQSKKEWNDLLANGAIPEFELEVQSPLVPVEVYWNSGSVNIRGWKQKLLVHQKSAQLSLSGFEGEGVLYAQAGRVEVSDFKGSLNLEAYDTEVSVKKGEGRFRLENFLGDSFIENLDGELQYTSYKGKLLLKGSKGKVNYDGQMAEVRLEGHSGPIRGKNSQGSLTANILGEADVNVQSKEGAITLGLPKSGANLNLGTEEGKLFLPNYLQVTRLPNQRLVRGKLRGSEGGSVRARTTTGMIKIR